MIIIPTLPTTPQLPRGHYMVTDDLCTALSKIPGVALPEFPEGIESWVRLPAGTFLVVYECTTHERLVCKHRATDITDPAQVIAFDRDQALLDMYLDG